MLLGLYYEWMLFRTESMLMDVYVHVIVCRKRFDDWSVSLNFIQIFHSNTRFGSQKLISLLQISNFVIKWLVNWKGNQPKRTNRKKNGVREIAKFNSNWPPSYYPLSGCWWLFWSATFSTLQDHRFSIQWNA